MTATPEAVTAGEAFAAQIATYITDLRYEDLPAETVAAAKGALLDELGIMLMGSTLPWTARAPGGRADRAERGLHRRRLG